MSKDFHHKWDIYKSMFAPPSLKKLRACSTQQMPLYISKSHIGKPVFNLYWQTPILHGILSCKNNSVTIKYWYSHYSGITDF